MPLYDHGCEFCGHCFEALAAVSTLVATCPHCGEPSPRGGAGRRSAPDEVIEARMEGLACAEGAERVGDLRRYRDEYGDDGPDMLLDDLWQPGWPGYDELKASCESRGLSWADVEDAVAKSFAVGWRRYRSRR